MNRATVQKAAALMRQAEQVERALKAIREKPKMLDFHLIGEDFAVPTIHPDRVRVSLDREVTLDILEARRVAIEAELLALGVTP
jgi:hypothetical protein